jgi:hypothetical protein
MPRLAWIALALIVGIIAILMLWPAPPTGTDPITSGAQAATPAIAAHPEPTPREPPVDSGPNTTLHPTAMMPAEATASAAAISATKAPAAVSGAIARPGRITGRVAAPVAGKPVAPVDITWDMAATGDRRQVVITITNRGGEAAALAATLTPRRLHLDGPTTARQAAVAPGADLVLDTTVVLDDDRLGGSLIVQTTHEALGVRTRVVTIDLPGNGPAPTSGKAREADGAPLHGVQRVVGADGRGILFMPAASPPATAAKRP